MPWPLKMLLWSSLWLPEEGIKDLATICFAASYLAKFHSCRKVLSSRAYIHPVYTHVQLPHDPHASAPAPVGSLEHHRQSVLDAEWVGFVSRRDGMVGTRHYLKWEWRRRLTGMIHNITNILMLSRFDKRIYCTVSLWLHLHTFTLHGGSKI